MSIFSYFTPAHAVRFLSAVRQDGWRSASRRTWYYLRLAFGGGGRSALSPPKNQGKPQPGPHYLTPFWRDMARAQAFDVARPALGRSRARIAMIADLNLAQCRKYRVQQLAGFWAEQGIDYDFVSPHDVPRSTDLLQRASHVMFYRMRAGAQMSMYLYEARRLGLPIAYDIDDPLFSVPAYATYGNMAALPDKMQAHFLAQAPGYLDAMNLADIVTLATPGLMRHAASLTPRPLALRRNFADADTLATGAAALAGAKPKTGPFRVAFASGSNGHEVDFDTISPVLETFLTTEPGRELMILGHFDPARLPEPLRPHTRFHPFGDYPAYLALLAQADCAVMPLVDDLFNSCKSGVRVIDAAAVAVPSLVAGIGDQPVLVQDGLTGHVVPPGGDWLVRLEKLAADRRATTDMGQAARADLEKRWSVSGNAHIADPALIDWAKS